MRGVLVASLGERYTEDMAAIDCPVQLVWGEQDTEVPLEVAVRAQGIFPRATLTVLPGVGHLVPTEAPAHLLAVILDEDDDARADAP
jgi:pimeloyl-ACP methyl ester carboxylesterase